MESKKAIYDLIPDPYYPPTLFFKAGTSSEKIIAAINENSFVIAESSSGDSYSAGLPPDLVICLDCCREMDDPLDRRHRYAFLNCTDCGPRYSIVESLPYDRPRTSMRAF